MKKYAIAVALASFTLSIQAAPAKPAAAKAVTLIGPTQSIGDVDFRAVRLGEIARLISQLSGYNVIASSKVADIEVSLYLRNTTLPSLVSNLCRATGLWYRFDRESRTYILMSEDEFRHDIAVARDDKTRILTLKHNNVVSAANAVKSLFGGRVQLEEPTEEAPPVALQPKNRGQLPDSNSINSSGSATSNEQTTRNSDGSKNSTVTKNRSGDMATVMPDSMRSIQQLVAQASANALKGLQEQQGKVNPTGAPIYLTYNKLHNLLMVRSADEDALTAIEQLIASIDLPAKQVLLEMQILELGIGDDFRSSFNVSFSDGKSSLSLGTGKTMTSKSFSYGFLNDKWQLKLEVLQSQNKLKVLSTPSLLSINNQPARLFIGEETILTTGISADTVTNNNQSNTKVTVETEKRDIGQTLTLLPRINADRSIALTIDQEVSTINKGGASLPITLNNRVVEWPVDTVSNATSQLTVLAQDGRSVIIGGLTRTRINRNTSKVPLLGDIPVLGHLFRDTNNESSEKQMVLIITPRLMDTETADFIADATAEKMRSSPATNTPQGGNIIAPFNPYRPQLDQP